MNRVHFTVTAAAILLAVAASGASKAKYQVQPRAGLWCVCGGTDDFRAFLRRIAGESPVQVFDSPEAMPYDSATNAIFFLLPDYNAGRHVVQELSVDVARRIKASQSRGNRFWVECYLSSTNLSRDVNICGTETYGTRPVYFNQEYVEWNGDVLQARRSYYLPAGIRGSGKSCIIKGEAHVSDCIGVHGVHRPGEHRLPATVVSMGGAVVGSLVNITQFDPMFMRPYGLWRTFYASQFGRISGVDTNVVASAFSATWPDFLSPSGGNDPKVALEKALEWHFKSGILNSHDGSKGMSEAILSDDFGYRRGLRTDSHLLTGALFAAAGVKMNRPEWVKLGRNLVDFILAEGVQSPEGFYSWFSPREGRAGDEVYSSDMGRDGLAMINMYKATGDVKYLESARKAADAFLMWMDGRGLNSGHFSNLSKGGWKVEGTNDNPVFYGEMVSFLLQMDDEKYRDAAIRTIDRISERFPAVAPFHFSDNFTYSRYLVMLACAQYATSRDYSGKINEMLDFFDKYTHRMGGITELPIRLDDDDEAGVGIGDGTDHIADILYCNNFVFNATSVLVKLPPERQKGVNMEKARRVYGNVRRFLLAAQIKSDDPRFDGAWMRAFDMDIGEYYGLNKDKGWGAYCIESGWVMGFIPAVLLFEGDAGSFFYAHEEKPFDYQKRLVAVHAPDRRDETVRPANDEFVFRDGVALAGADDPLVRRGLDDFSDYLSTSMGVRAAKGGSEAAAGRVAVALDDALEKREYVVEVAADGIKISAKDGRAAMQALFHLEDVMNLRRAPYLPFGRERRRMRFSPRMTHSGYARDIFPDGHLAQIAHAGFDAILFNISGPDLILEAYGHTNVNALIDAAAAWGLDSYLYSHIKATRHPDDPESPAEMAATYGAVARLHNKAKGLLIVPESCHFMSRDPRMKCLRDSAFFPCSDWPLYLRRIEETIRAGNPGIDLVFWTYNFYSRPEKDRFAFIDAITPTTTLNVTFAIGDEREHPTRLGKSFPVSDYSIATSGPSHLFRAEAAHGHARGLKVYTTSNTGGRTWDVGCAPFEPVPQRWKARFDALVAAQTTYGLAGLIESHQYGFAPNFVAELAKEAFTEGGMDFDSHLRAIAARDFGEAHADEVVATWADLSDAIRDNVATSQNQYGPLRLGPAYPFNALGPLLKKGDWPGFTSWMCNPNYGYYIPWGKPFGTVEQPREELDEETHKVEIELFGSAGRRFVAGGEKLRRFADELSGERRLHARREAGVVEYIGRCFLTTSNVKAGAIAERVATDCGRSVSEREAAKRRVGEIARMEYANTRASLDLLRENSHLGSLNIGAMLSTSSEYIGGLERVEWKLRHMEKIYGIDGTQM